MVQEARQVYEKLALRDPTTFCEIDASYPKISWTHA